MSERLSALLLAAAAVVLVPGCEAAPADALPAVADAAPADDCLAAQSAAALQARRCPADPVVDTAAVTSPQDDAGARSLETVEGRSGEIEPVRTLLFSDSGVLEESVVAKTLGDGTPVLLAIGRSDVASFVVYLLLPGDAAAPGHTAYHVASRVLQEPADVLDGSIALAAWDATPRSRRLRITLDLAHDVTAPGGDPATGEPAARHTTRQVQLDYDPASGRLEPAHG